MARTGRWHRIGLSYPRSVPELPEVELYSRLARGALGPHGDLGVGSRPWFIKGGADGPPRFCTGGASAWAGSDRIGKLMLIDLDEGPTLGIRFGMTGTPGGRRSGGNRPARSTPPGAATRMGPVSLGFGDGGSLVVRDPRRLGGVMLDPDLSRLGPDAATVSTSALADGLRGSKAPLKARLLDQSHLSGIGNLMADEVLWRSGLSPLRPAGSLSTAEVRRLKRHPCRRGPATGRRAPATPGAGSRREWSCLLSPGGWQQFRHVAEPCATPPQSRAPARRCAAAPRPPRPAYPGFRRGAANCRLPGPRPGRSRPA